MGLEVGRSWMQENQLGSTYLPSPPLPPKKKSLGAWVGSGSEEDEQVPADWGSGCGVTQQTYEAPV